REPVSPLFAALQHTSQAIELQITQEYTGQQRHMVFLVPMWKTALDTDLRAQNRSTPVKEIVEGKSFHQPGEAKRLGGSVTVANGTGYIGQYPPELAKMYEKLNTCPDDLLLFMHHVPYTHVLNDGKTVVQHIYDAHYEGAATAQTYVPRWQTLHGLIDDDRYNETLKPFTCQAAHAIVWRDAATRWFQKQS